MGLKRHRAEQPHAVRTTLSEISIFNIQLLLLLLLFVGVVLFAWYLYNIICILWSVGIPATDEWARFVNRKPETVHANTQETVRRWRNTFAHASSSLRHTRHVPNVKFHICLWILWNSHAEPLPSALSTDFPGVVYYYYYYFFTLYYLFSAPIRAIHSRARNRRCPRKVFVELSRRRRRRQRTDEGLGTGGGEKNHSPNTEQR